MSGYDHADACRKARERIVALYAETRDEREAALAQGLCEMEARRPGAGRAFLERVRRNHGQELYMRIRARCIEKWKAQQVQREGDGR